jgi:hypothetical protein
VVEIGDDDEADVRAEPRRLDMRDGAPFADSGFGSMPCLGVTTRMVLL